MSLFVGNSILAKKTVAMFCSGSRPDGEELDLPGQARSQAGGAGEWNRKNNLTEFYWDFNWIPNPPLVRKRERAFKTHCVVLSHIDKRNARIILLPFTIVA